MRRDGGREGEGQGEMEGGRGVEGGREGKIEGSRGREQTREGGNKGTNVEGSRDDQEGMEKIGRGNVEGGRWVGREGKKL